MTESSGGRSFSVVLPVLNESDSIEHCLDSILAANSPEFSLEIIVVDGISEDGTREIVDEYASRHFAVQLVDNERQTTPAGMNKGFQVATKDIIVLLGGHAWVSDQFFNHIIELFRERAPDADVVGTRVSVDTDGYVQTAIGGALVSRFGAGSRRFRPYEGYVDTVSFGAYKREVVETVGDMDLSLPRGQDYEYNMRVRSAGFRIYQSAERMVYYEPRSTLGGLLSQKFGNGRAKARLRTEEGARSVPSSVVAATALVLMLPGLIVAGSVAGLLYVLLMIVAAVEVAATDPQYGFRHVPGITVALGTIHAGYGTGYILELLRNE